MAAVITLEIGTLPPPACYANEQERAEAIIDATTALLSGGIQWQVGTVAPTDLALYWAQVDGNGRLLNVLKWSTTDGSWLPALSAFIWGGNATGSLSNYAITPSPAFLTVGSAYQFGRIYAFRANHTNTGAASLNVSGLGTKNITKNGTVALAAGDIVVDQQVLVQYDGTEFQMLSPVVPNPKVAVANITPGTAEQVITTRADLTVGWETRIYNTAPGAEVSIPAPGSPVTFTHGLLESGVQKMPSGYQVKLRCVLGGDPAGYSIDDEIDVSQAYAPGGTAWCTTWIDDTVVGLIFDGGATGPNVSSKGAGVSTAIVGANWKLCAEAHW